MTNRKGAGRGTGKGYKNLRSFPKDSSIHSQSARGRKQPQRIPYIKKDKFEKINIISNINTINLKDLKKKQPLSYAYLCLRTHLYNSGMSLNFVNQDKNRVYFTITNKINNYTSEIMELSNEELLRMDLYLVQGIKDKVWGKR